MNPPTLRYPATPPYGQTGEVTKVSTTEARRFDSIPGPELARNLRIPFAARVVLVIFLPLLLERKKWVVGKGLPV
jgi:hypothetical protein